MEVREVPFLLAHWDEWPPVHVAVRAALGGKLKTASRGSGPAPTLKDIEAAVRAARARMN